MGLESEYAFRLSPPPDSGRRAHHLGLFRSIAAAIRERVRTRDGRSTDKVDVFFTENGGSFSYEGTPSHFESGLVEAATPECRSPTDVLLYQRAQERLLAQALPAVSAEHALRGHSGDIGLLRNCRDAAGNLYGVQENYEVDIATGPMLALYRVGLGLMLPLVLVGQLVAWGLFLVVIAVVLVVAAVNVLGEELFGWHVPNVVHDLMHGADGATESLLIRCTHPVLVVLGTPLIWPQVQWYRAVAFRRIRRSGMAFFASRVALLGEGTIEPDGTYHLSEKGLGMARTIRATAAPADRAIIDTGHFIELEIGQWLRRFARRQRLQVGLSFGNRCQVAEYLKVGTTSLVLDMIEAGWLRDAPRLRDPVGAVKRFGADPTLTAAEPVRGADPSTALALQRFYLERAERFVADAAVPSLEASRVVALWREVLDGLETDPASLFGRLDWVTKRVLVEEVAPAPADVLKKVDLRYHEVGSGYHAWLEAEGLSPMLVTDEEIEAAIDTPPQNTRARLRGELVRQLAREDRPVAVDWGSVRVGGWLRGEVVRLDDHR